MIIDNEHNTRELELTIIGLLFQYPDKCAEKITQLNKDDFKCKEARRVFVCCEKSYKKRGTIDYTDIFTYVKQPSDKSVIYEAAQLAITPSNMQSYIDMLKEARIKDKLNKRMTEMVFAGYEFSDINDLVDALPKHKTSVIEDSTEELMNFYCSLAEVKEVVKSGYSAVDNRINGFEKGTMFILGARPSVGKTSFAINLVTKMWEISKKSIMFFSLEMSTGMIYERLLSSRLNIPYSDLSKHNLKALGENAGQRIVSLVDRLLVRQDFIVNDRIHSVEEICNTVYQNKPDVVVVDFIQIVSTEKEFFTERERIAYISAQLKRCAKSTGALFIVLSQMTRTAKDEPTMSELRESGSLEQDGDYIVLLHRPYVNDKDEDPRYTEFRFDKNKFGWTGHLVFDFDGTYQKFTSVTTRYDDTEENTEN